MYFNIEVLKIDEIGKSRNWKSKNCKIEEFKNWKTEELKNLRLKI